MRGKKKDRRNRNVQSAAQGPSAEDRSRTVAADDAAQPAQGPSLLTRRGTIRTFVGVASAP